MNPRRQQSMRPLAVALLALATFMATIVGVPTSPAEAQVPPASGFLGDVNCDDTVNIVDAYVIAVNLVGSTVSTQCGNPLSQITAIGVYGDVDGSGEVDIIDALIIAGCSVGLNLPFCAAIGQAMTPDPVSHDEVSGAIEVIPTAEGTHVQGPVDGIATGGPGEVNPNPWPFYCFNEYEGNTVWYEFVATSSRVSIHSGQDDQIFGILRAADGIAEPTSALDLEIVGCGEGEMGLSAITEPGERYWIVSSYYWHVDFELFDRDVTCSDFWECPRGTNDDWFTPAYIDVKAGDSVLIDDHNPGLTTIDDLSQPWSFDDGETPDVVGDCIVQAPGSGSVWYSFVAEGTTASVSGNAGLAIGFADDDLNFLSCDDASASPTLSTVPGERYLIVASGPTLGEPFTLTHN